MNEIRLRNRSLSIYLVCVAVKRIQPDYPIYLFSFFLWFFSLCGRYATCILRICGKMQLIFIALRNMLTQDSFGFLMQRDITVRRLEYQSHLFFSIRNSNRLFTLFVEFIEIILSYNSLTFVDLSLDLMFNSC